MRTTTLYAAITAASLGCCMHVVAGPAEASIAAPNAAALERCLGARAEQEAFSGVISVTHHGQPVVSLVKGVVAGPGSAPIGAATRFNLASMGKMFTAVAIGQLVDAGKVHWDDPVGKYVSGLTPEASIVTVRQLLTHSSGLGDFFKPQNMDAMLKARTASDILPLIAADKPSFAPGSKFSYSNSGFALLGVVIERVSGQSYGDYLREHIFAPAGMTDTGLSPQPVATLAVGMTSLRLQPVSTAAQTRQVGSAGHPAQGGPDEGNQHDGLQLQPSPGASATPPQHLMLIGPDGKPIEANTARGNPTELQPAPGATESFGSPAGGAYSTAADMQHFADALLQDKLVGAATRNALTSQQIVAYPASDGKPERSYGMGFGVGTEDGKRWFGHNGGTAGANAEFAEFPEDQWTLEVLSNRDPPVASTLFRYLKDLLFKPDALKACADATAH